MAFSAPLRSPRGTVITVRGEAPAPVLRRPDPRPAPACAAGHRRHRCRAAYPARTGGRGSRTWIGAHTRARPVRHCRCSVGCWPPRWPALIIRRGCPRAPTPADIAAGSAGAEPAASTSEGPDRRGCGCGGAEAAQPGHARGCSSCPGTATATTRNPLSDCIGFPIPDINGCERPCSTCGTDAEELRCHGQDRRRVAC